MIDGLFRWLRDTRGAVSPLMALLVVPIVGALALAGESGGWYYTNRSAQNAADSAAVAAATNNCTTGSCGASYILEARGAAARFGFVNGTDNATVTPTYPVTCPDGTPGCYRVRISKIVPVHMGRIVGFNGDVALGGGRGQTVTAEATARGRVNAGFCIMALGTTNNAFRINGGPNFNLGGCDVYSNGGANCNGSSTYGINAAVAVNNSDCGVTPTPNSAAISDPYAALSTAANIPPGSGCTLAPSYTNAVIDLSTPKCKTSGNITINGNVTITSPVGGAVMTLYGGGGLILNGSATLTVTGGNGATIIFSGTAGANTPGFITGDGTIDMSAPTTGTWKGVALYQDSRMTGTGNLTYAGNNPTFNITGLVYAPAADLTFKGAINHATGGYSCLGVVAKTLTVSGTGSIFANATSQCMQAGLNLPTGPTLLYRQALVQ
jgi:hypothetical protein